MKVYQEHFCFSRVFNESSGYRVTNIRISNRVKIIFILRQIRIFIYYYHTLTR